MDKPNADGIAIPYEKIDAWKRRRSELERIIAEAQREASEITRKLDAVAILAPELRFAEFKLTPPDIDQGEPSVIDHIVAVVNEQNAYLLPKHIRRFLRQREGVPKFSENYFYTALKRAYEKELIDKEGDRYGPPYPSKENPEAGTSGSDGGHVAERFNAPDS